MFRGDMAMNRLAGLALASALAAGGCSHGPKNEDRVSAPTGVPAPTTPAFMSGPMALLLTNLNGFRARASVEDGSPASRSGSVAGDLMEREGKLLFTPDAAAAPDAKAHPETSAFIWYVKENSGFILNGPLQGYAPISSSRGYTNVVVEPAAKSATERIAGHACEATQVTVKSSDGATSVFQVWRAPDLQGLPLRISGGAVTLTLSRVRLELPPEEVFVPPGDFTKYNSAEGMMNELAMRQHSLKGHPRYEPPPTDTIGAKDVKAPTPSY